MKLHLNTSAAAIDGEEELFNRLERLHKRNDNAYIAHIGVKNSAGQVRVSIRTYTNAEQSGVLRLLEDRGFHDELEEVVEHEEGDGWIEDEHIKREDPVFDYLYAPTKSH